ncbi:AAA family ATPase [Trichlorobacter lovleyi]|uniref:nucleotide-binding protein n=1 Tax=Trichlorobacter lovleyi TaxID=313985 RepID=UPI003D116AEB
MEDTSRHTEIWAVGGGKGGTGKSFITSSMGTCLALKGKKTLLLDADLGGANLHNFFGLISPKRSLTDFFEKRALLQELIVHTGIANLELITGSTGSLDSESINYAQKQRLFRHIRALDADTILIDLGGGTHINTLDTFLLADKMIVVTVPEITAIENMYQFVKSVYYRKLKSIFKAYDLNTVVQDTWKNRTVHNIRNLKDLIGYLKQGSEQIRAIFNREMSGFVVHIILNEVRSPKDILIGENLKRACVNFLGLQVVYSGYASYDEAVHKSINNKEAFMLFNRLSPVVKEIRQLTEHIETETAFSVPEDLLDGRIL